MARHKTSQWAHTFTHVLHCRNQSSRDADEVILPPPDQYHKAYVNASYNNTKITVTDADGATVTWVRH